MNVRALKNVYFIGVGGIGMSALARFFNDRGVKVSGYDKTESELTRKLSAEGISIHYEDDLKHIDKQTELVVYTPAIPKTHIELNWYKDNNYPVYKRSDVLQWITESLFSITIAGTHGKTTTSTIISYLLRETGYGCNAFLGGVSVNYDRNYWSSDNQVAVIEADEYDRSFLKLHPDIALLTSMDPDHLDIYGTVDEMEKAFIQYTQNIKKSGKLLVKHGMHRECDFNATNKVTYSLQNDVADTYATNILQRHGGYVFDLVSPFGNMEQVELNIGGMHNVENTVAALTVGLMLGIDASNLKSALAGFRGIKRRFEYILRNEKTIFIDDYAHHPEELAALIGSAKKLFPHMKCVLAFQPHLFTRTRDLADGFAKSLDMADQVILLDIYPARELPIEGITSEMITQKMANPAHTILSKEGLLEFVRASKIELLITAGAGDIDRLVNPIKEILEKLIMTKKRKISMLKVLRALVTLVVTSCVVVGVLGASKKQEKEKLKDILLHIRNEKAHFFIDKQTMWHQLISVRGIEVNKTMIQQIKVGAIETEALQNPWVENPQVYIDNNNVLHIFVSQRKPVARVFFDNGQSFYLDPTLKLLPLSNMFTYYTTIVTNVPVYNNDSLDNDMRGRILKLVKFIDQDTFWNAQIAQVIVTTKGDFELIPVLGTQTIVFGDTIKMVEKFNNLFAFYKKVLNRIGWDKYTQLDLRYENQIVATPAIPYTPSSKNALSNMDWVKSILDAQPKTDTGSTTLNKAKSIDNKNSSVVNNATEEKKEKIDTKVIQLKQSQKVFAIANDKTTYKEHGRH